MEMDKSIDLDHRVRYVEMLGSELGDILVCKDLWEGPLGRQ